jgi:hypothetical protein
MLYGVSFLFKGKEKRTFNSHRAILLWPVQQNGGGNNSLTAAKQQLFLPACSYRSNLICFSSQRRNN